MHRRSVWLSLLAASAEGFGGRAPRPVQQRWAGTSPRSGSGRADLPPAAPPGALRPADKGCDGDTRRASRRCSELTIDVKFWDIWAGQGAAAGALPSTIPLSFLGPRLCGRHRALPREEPRQGRAETTHRAQGCSGAAQGSWAGDPAGPAGSGGRAAAREAPGISGKRRQRQIGRAHV